MEKTEAVDFADAELSESLVDQPVPMKKAIFDAAATAKAGQIGEHWLQV